MKCSSDTPRETEPHKDDPIALPIEIIYRICEAVAEPHHERNGFIKYHPDIVPPDPPYRDLTNLALVCRHVLPTVRQLLYRSIRLSSSKAYRCLCNTLSANSSFGLLIRHLSIHDRVVYRSEVLGVHAEELWRFLHKCRYLSSIYFNYSTVHTMRYIRGALPVLDYTTVCVFRAHSDLAGELSFQPLPRDGSLGKRLLECESLTMHCPTLQTGEESIQLLEGYDLIYAGATPTDFAFSRLPVLTQLYLSECLKHPSMHTLVQLLAPRLETLAIRERHPQQYPALPSLLDSAQGLCSLSLINLELEAESFAHLPPTIRTLRLTECIIAGSLSSVLLGHLDNLPYLEYILLDLKESMTQSTSIQLFTLGGLYITRQAQFDQARNQVDSLEKDLERVREMQVMKRVCAARSITLEGKWELLHVGEAMVSISSGTLGRKD